MINGLVRADMIDRISSVFDFSEPSGGTYLNNTGGSASLKLIFVLSFSKHINKSGNLLDFGLDI